MFDHPLSLPLLSPYPLSPPSPLGEREEENNKSKIIKHKYSYSLFTKFQHHAGQNVKQCLSQS
jgi:hypothetical protein